ncbi:MAG: hypothetical protein RJQ09_16520 [Cyclobacteriaceae bacterium]
MQNDSLVIYYVQLHPEKLEISVKMELSGVAAQGAGEELILNLPSWVPGDYEFEPYGRDIFNVRAIHPNGQTIKVSRAGLNGYAFENAGQPLIVTYQASCYEPDLGDAMGLVDSDYAVLMGTRYLFNQQYVGPCIVDYGTLPEGWQLHHPSGADRVPNTNKWNYPGFEILLDTPVSFGKFSLLEREVKGTRVYFLFVDKSVGFDETVNRFIDQVSLATEKIYEVFGLFPFSDYTFVLSLNPQADWGLEHLTSNMSGLGPDVFVDERLYSNGVRVCVHELFHAWNVRRLRPAPLGQLRHQLNTGSFTEGLWMAEGFTRYYEFLISTRARAYTPDQFFSAIAGYYQHLTQQPAYQRVSVTDSSLATYMNHSKYPGRVNNSIDYYDKGMLIAFGIDVFLRSAIDKKQFQSLDEAFKAFYLKFFGSSSTVPPEYVGYSTDEVISFFEEVDTGLGSKIAAQLNEPKKLDTIDMFEALGFKVMEEDINFIGLFFMDDGAPTIYGVGDDSPSGLVGIAPNDIIQTVNGFAYSDKSLMWAAKQTSPVQLEVLRGHRKLNFVITPQPFKKFKSLCWQGISAQAKTISSWLECDFEPNQGKVFLLDFYDNFHGIEKMV